VEAWKNTEYPRIKEMARQEDAEIYFEDEAGISTTSQSGTTWSPEGETPVVETAGSGLRLNMASAVSPKGDMHFTTLEGSMNSDRFIEFLKKLLHEKDRPVFLITDNHSAHVSKKTRDFVESTNGRLELFTLPPYSPELNPDEQVWNHVKNHEVEKQKLNGMNDLEEKTRKALEAFQRTPRIIRNFFQKPEACYALE
jgi:transposase